MATEVCISKNLGGDRAIDIKLSLLKNDKKVLPALITA